MAAEPFLSEIQIFAFQFAPKNWAQCNGQTLAINNNQALFALLGTTYGGNGQTTFALPDFRGRTAIGTGQGPGLSNITLGQLAGTPSVTLTTGNMPAHTHPLTGTVSPQGNQGAAGLNNDPSNRRFAGTNIFTGAATDLATMAPAVSTLAIGVTGGSQPFSIMPPYLGMNYIICLFGIFPSRD